MSMKGTITKADHLEWNEMLSLVHRLYRDGDYRMSLLVATQSMWGLRIGDELNLRWREIVDVDEILVTEHKTGKKRRITVNKNLRSHIRFCYESLESPSLDEPVFYSRQHSIYSREWVNSKLHSYKEKYHLNIKNYTSHSHRKTFARHILEISENPELALIKISELFSHSSTAITRRYLNLRDEEMAEVYLSLDF